MKMSITNLMKGELKDVNFVQGFWIWIYRDSHEGRIESINAGLAEIEKMPDESHEGRIESKNS